jgi:hypothetical protein
MLLQMIVCRRYAPRSATVKKKGHKYFSRYLNKLDNYAYILNLAMIQIKMFEFGAVCLIKIESVCAHNAHAKPKKPISDNWYQQNLNLP